MPTNYVTKMSKTGGDTFDVMDKEARTLIAAEVTARQNAVSAEATDRQSAVSAEAAARQAAVAAEATARQEAVAAEAAARQAAVSAEETARQTAVSAEATARQNADAAERAAAEKDLNDYKQILNLEISWTDGKYQNSSGELVSNENYSYSNYIDIHAYSGLIVSAAIIDLAAVCLFDDSKTCISGTRNPDSQTIPYTYFIDLTDPSYSMRAHYIRLCSLKTKKDGTILFPRNDPNAKIRVIQHTAYGNMDTKYRNLNNLPSNSVVGYKFGWTDEIAETMKHFPYTGFMGEIITINSTLGDNVSSWGFQLAVGTDSENTKSMYFRTRFQSWGSWYKLNQYKQADVMYVYDNYMYAEMPEILRDCDTIPANTIAGYHFGWTEEITATMQHFPAVPFTGEIMTMNTVKGMQSFGVQLAFEEFINSKRVWYRTRYADWGEWMQLADSSMLPVISSGAFRGLGNFVLCGDSLSVGLSYKDSTSVKTVKSWGSILAGMMDAECDVFAQGGITTGGYLNSNLFTQACANESQFAVLYLGTNDANQSVSKETFKTNYQALINGLLVNHQFVLCVNLPEVTSASTRNTYNEGIAEVCAVNDKAFLVNVAKYNSYFAPFRNWGHLSSVGYAAFAEAASWAIDETLKDNDYFDADIDFPELME